MNRFLIRAAALGFVLAALPAFAAGQDSNAQKGGGQGQAPGSAAAQPQQQETHGSVTVEGNRISYDAYAGTLILKNDDEKPIASMSYVAYMKSGVKDASDRPITFLYNGGPGSSTIWLHMLAFGPELVKVGNGTLTPPAPFQMVNNDYSLLDASDLVFVDAPGTGFGRVAGKDKDKAFFGFDPDAHAFARFITLFLSKYGRWNSPKYLFGESYGTTRSALVAFVLEMRDSVDLNGVILLSQVLNFDLLPDGPKSNPSVDLPYVLALPTYAATAWYHKKLPGAPRKLDALLTEVEAFAAGDYTRALARGLELSVKERHALAERLHGYTGLPVAYLEKANLRIDGREFEKNLKSDTDTTVGRLDTRFTGPTMDPLSQRAEYDPQSAAISSAYVTAFNTYVRKELGYTGTTAYKPRAGLYRTWDFEHQPPGAPR